MAYTKAQLEALKNSILASAQPITAAQHRSMVQNIIDEMYDAQSRGNLLAGVQADGSAVGGDTILLIRGGQIYQVPATLFGGSGGNLADLGDVLIIDPEDEDILSFDVVAGKWKNIPLTGLFVTQAQLDAALDALQLPEGARLVSAELLLTSDTAGTITAQWVDFLGETESVTAEALAFNGGGLPGAGNFRFDIVQGANDGTVNVKEGTEADAASVVVPSADADHVVLVVVLWAEDGTAEVSPPGGGNAQQNVWSLVRQITPVTPGSAGLFSKVWEGNLSAYDNYSLSLAYAEPKEVTTFEGSGFQILKVSFTCTGARVIIADTVQIETGPGSTAGEFVLYQISGNKAALYHKSSHYWGRIQYRVLFQNSQVRLQDFVSNSAYGAAPSASATYPSTVAGEGIQGITGDGVDNTDPDNPVISWPTPGDIGAVASVSGPFVDNTDPENPEVGYQEATERASNTVLFDKDYIIGNAASRTGNVLFDFTGAKLGSVTFMKHDNSGAYTFPTEGEVRDFEIAKLALVTGDVWFGFTLVDKTASSEVVFIQLSLTEAQVLEYNA